MKVECKTIAFLSRSISEYAGSQLWAGISSAAARRGVNLLCWSGGQLHKDPESFIYEYFDPSRVDGTIGWASSNTDADEQYYLKLAEYPLVTLSLPISGIPTVTVDCYAGMLEAMEHLITVHGKRKIAYLRGPEAHIYAQERHQAYLDALKRHGIPFDGRLVSPPGDFSQVSGEGALALLMDERGLAAGRDFDALIAVNDLGAIGAIAELGRRKFRVPEDVAVIGYNDSRDGRCITPPLTTVAMPFRDQGEKAFELLLMKLEGREIPERTELAANLVVRNSCGCVSPSVMRIGGNRGASEHGAEDGRLDSLHSEGGERSHGREEAIIKDCADICRSGTLTEECVQKSVETLYAGYLEALRSKTRLPYLNSVEAVIRSHIEDMGHIDAFHDLITSMRKAVLPTISDRGEKQFASELLDQSRVMVSEAAERMKEYQNLEVTRREKLLLDIGSLLITTFNLEKLISVLSESLPQLGIPACFIVRTDTGMAQMIMAYDAGGIRDIGSAPRFNPREHVPETFLPKGGGAYTLVTEALGFDTVRLGYIVFMLGPEDGSIYNNLRNMLSSALYGAFILKESRDMKNLIARHLGETREKATKISRRSLAASGAIAGIAEAMRATGDAKGIGSSERAEGGGKASSEISRRLEEAAANLKEITREINVLAGLGEEESP